MATAAARRSSIDSCEHSLAPVNHKRVYRVMAINRLLLARRYTERPDYGHDGIVVTIRSNLRWCSDGFEFGCWNGEIVRDAFIIDAHDREVMPGARSPMPASAGPTSAT
jgi:transposase InsO family protein